MSKSKGNVVNPNEYIKEYGADAFRVYLMFMGVYLEGGDFRDEGVRAMRSFLDRVHANIAVGELIEGPPEDKETLYWTHRTIKAVTSDIQRFSYNTSLARLMELLNHITKANVKNRQVHETFLILLAPFAPFLTEELWERLGNTDSIFNQSWPEWIEEHTKQEAIEYVVQINGKVRAKFEIGAGTPQPDIEAQVLEEPKVKKWIEGKTIIRKIFVPDKLVNIVVK